MSSFVEERQGLIEAAVEKLREKTAELDHKATEYVRKAAEFDRKNAENDRRTSQLEMALAVVQNRQEFPRKQQQKEIRMKDVYTVDLDDTNSHLLFQREIPHHQEKGGVGRNDDDEGSFLDNPDFALRSPNSGVERGNAERSAEGDEYQVDQENPFVDKVVERNLDLQDDNDLYEEMELLRDRVDQLESSNSSNQRMRRSSKFSSVLPSLFARQEMPPFRQNRGTIALETDVFSIMMRSKIFSKGWFLGIFCFFFQVTLVVFGPMTSFVLKQASGSAIFNMPLQPPSASVRVVQILTLILSLFTQSDLLSSIHLILLVFRIRDGVDWDPLINNEEERSHPCSQSCLLFNRIYIPNILKFTQGMSVLAATWFIIIQSVDGADLLQDYTALLVISQTDNVIFVVADYGFLGMDLSNAADDVKCAQIEVDDNLVNGRWVRMAKSFSMTLILTVLLSAYTIFAIEQSAGTYFYDKYPYCTIPVTEIPKIGDGYCDGGGQFNTVACSFDGGDCIEFNLEYPNCKATEPELVGNDQCNFDINTEECNFDGSDCCPYDYGVNGTDPRLGDGVCDGGYFFTQQCSYDEFDCQDFRSRVQQVPGIKCDIEVLANLVDGNHIPRLGDGTCDSKIYNRAECLFEDGDCIECNAQVHDFTRTGDGICQGGRHNSQLCNWDAGDCFEFNEKFPLCVNRTLDNIYSDSTMKYVPIIGDGICNSGLYNNEDCGYEDGDCLACNIILDEKGLDRIQLGNRECDGAYNFTECGFDGGDCLL